MQSREKKGTIHSESDDLIDKYLKVSLYIDGVFHAIRSGNYLIERGGAEEFLEQVNSKKREETLLREVFRLPRAAEKG